MLQKHGLKCAKQIRMINEELCNNRENFNTALCN